jgi:YHS domain-containing protein
MIRWIILLIIGYLAYRFFKGLLSPRKEPRREPPQEIQDEMVQDPVCQIYLPKRQAISLSGPDGMIRYFCSTRCRDTFIRKDASKNSSEGLRRPRAG